MIRHTKKIEFKNIDYKRIFLLAGIIAVAIIIFSSLLIISRVFDATRSPVPLEKVEEAYIKLVEWYGEQNFLPEKNIIKIIRDEINIYKDSKYFEDGLMRMTKYKSMISDILEKNEIDKHYIYIAFVESMFDPEAFNSKTGAKGMWQLMPETAKSFGLRVGETLDERTDPGESTLAAARYLKYLQNIFGKEAFTLIVASYNAGEGRIRKSIKKLNGPDRNKNFWKLYDEDLIPGQTKAFVVRVITFMLLGEGLITFEK